MVKRHKDPPGQQQFGFSPSDFEGTAPYRHIHPEPKLYELAKDDKHHAELVRLLEEGGNPNTDNFYYKATFAKSPLLEAVRHGAVKNAKALLEAGAHLNIADDICHSTPLHIASVRGDADMVKLLLDQTHIQENMQDAGGDTALHVAVREGHLKVVVALLDAGAKRDIQNNMHQTPAMVAAEAKGCCGDRAKKILLRTIEEVLPMNVGPHSRQNAMQGALAEVARLGGNKSNGR